MIKLDANQSFSFFFIAGALILLFPSQFSSALFLLNILVLDHIQDICIRFWPSVLCRKEFRQKLMKITGIYVVDHQNLLNITSSFES